MMARSATSRLCNCAWANVRFHHESWSICQSLVKEQLSRKRSPHREFVALYLVGCFWVFDIFGLDVKRCGFLMPSIETCQFYVLLVGFEDGVRWNLYTFKVQYLRDPDAKHRTCITCITCATKTSQMTRMTLALAPGSQLRTDTCRSLRISGHRLTCQKTRRRFGFWCLLMLVVLCCVRILAWHAWHDSA